MSRVVIWLPLLALVYALTLASFDPWDLATGVVLGAAVLALFWRYPLIEPDGGRRQAESPSVTALLWFWPFAAVMVWEIVKGTWLVTLVVLGRHSSDQAGLVEIPIGDRTPLGVAIFGLAMTLSPGSVLVNVDWDEGVMLYHLLDASDPDAVRAQFAWLYERWQRRVIP